MTVQASSEAPPRRAFPPVKLTGWALYLAVVVAVGSGYFVLAFVTVGEWVLRVDAVTGTTTARTTWPLRISSGDVVNVSPLEERLKALGVAWTPDWRFMSANGRTILGGVTYRACSGAPPIHEIRSVLKEFAEGLTDAELREFVRVMQHGTEAEQRAAVEAAGEKAHRAMASNP
jgi:hypothetical protein